jgi:hypothetical protein
MTRLGLVASFVWGASALAAPPSTLVHQGRLVGPAGGPLQGPTTLVLSLYTQASGGSPVWTETESATLVDGYFTATLGDQSSLGALDFGGSSYWVEVAIQGGAALSPRAPLRAVPVAMALAGPYRPTPMTTTERDALTAEPGMLIFNSSVGELQTYDGTDWVRVGADTSDATPGRRLYGWGSGLTGGLGLGNTTNQQFPIEVPIPVTLTRLSTGGYSHGSDGAGCGITTTNGLWCWGDAAFVPDGSSADVWFPVNVTSGFQWRDVHLGQSLVGCGITTANVGYCWGYQQYGALGNGVNASSYIYSPTRVSGTVTWKTLRPSGRYNGSVHVAYTCGVSTVTGAANGYCWGRDDYGVLANGTNVTHNYVAPGSPIPGFEWLDIEPGQYHACGLVPNGDAYCWGNGGSGRLGNGAVDHQHSPVLVAGGLKWVKLAPGASHTCGLTTDGLAYCWGDAASGKLGTGNTADHVTPAPVLGGKRWTDISVGDNHTCALDVVGTVYCWGDGGSWRLGDGDTAANLVPYPIYGQARFTDIAVGMASTMGLTR